MGRFVHRFEDQTRPVGKHDGAAETVKFVGQLLLGTLTVAFLCGISWMMASGDSRFFMRFVNHYF
ncbi:hypothetical protein CCR94_08570 [Rhodoblastus sphagnicola]|uniref:Uncharacterized protein n=1 Tax=Rhodoblastus sphagnicola TaxID=333368 RepID=A0A2S6NAH2_9HYPH|nr:hypothetical protein [Rhodoblastus sphagnicola]MBB4199564.1 hypothetical protein [Rhodoblastus sphagnicola]PPQ31594.1 hypothetical protein CCR94_08570 [Rhodoblastus sphagnicola]